MPELPASFAPVVALGLAIVQALILLVVGWFVAGRLSALVRRRITHIPRVDPTIAVVAGHLVHYVLLAAVVIAVLQTFGFQVTSLVAVLGAATLAVGLALQGTLSHLAAGIMLLVFRPYRLGDFVEVGGSAGTVSDLNLFLTELTTPQGVKVFLPNGNAWGATIVNHSLNPLRRCDLTFGIDYEDDAEKAMQVILDVVAADERFLDQPAPPWVRVVSLSENSVDIELRVWARADDLWEARFATVKAVKEAFDRAGISIPFPHRVMVAKDSSATAAVAD